MKFRNLAVAAAGISFLAVSALAQITTIEGVAKGPDGKPLEKAEILITRTDIKGNYKVKTDKKGHYLYMGLPMGTYNLDLMVNGKLADSVKNVRTRPGDPTPVNFDLKDTMAAKAQAQAEMAKAIETGQLSKEQERSLTPEQKAAMEKQIKEQAEKMKKNKDLNDAFNAGMEAMTAKNWAAAVEAFNKAAVADPTQTAIYQQLGEAHMRMADGKTGAEYDAAVGESMKAYGKAIELKPDDPATHNNFALALGKAKKYPEMQAELKKAADLDPANGGKYYYNLGAMLVNSGQPEAAGEAFKKAIELTPTYADAYYQYGITLIGQAKVDAATGKVTPVPGTAEAFQKYLELAPTGIWSGPAKDMLASLGTSVTTKFTDPNAPVKGAPKKKK
jgi:tetratricopeptide (TPR) repeat protein